MCLNLLVLALALARPLLLLLPLVLLLVLLLHCAMLNMRRLPFSRLLNPLAALLISVTAILLFAEIAPQVGRWVGPLHPLIRLACLECLQCVEW